MASTQSNEIMSIALTSSVDGTRKQIVRVRHDEQTGQHVLEIEGYGQQGASAAQPLGTQEQAVALMQQRVDQIRQGALGQSTSVEILNDGGGSIR